MQNESESWTVRKIELKAKFAELTNSNFLFLKDQEKEMIEKLIVKFGKTKEEIYLILNSL